MRHQPQGPPMTLADMRENGVTHLTVSCTARGCGRRVDVDMATHDGALVVKSFEGRFRCDVCGSRDSHV